jgi:hypothetical protein
VQAPCPAWIANYTIFHRWVRYGNYPLQRVVNAVCCLASGALHTLTGWLAGMQAVTLAKRPSATTVVAAWLHVLETFCAAAPL